MNHFITLEEAIEMIARYKNQLENLLKPEFQNLGILTLSEAFDRSPFDIVLDKAGCEGLRFYYGMSPDLKIHAIIVGTDENGGDIITMTNGSPGGEGDDDIIERGTRCPDICPGSSPLNV
jgi:hypothetical protein